VIISEPSNPWIAGVGNLFTKEFYEEARRRLSRGGIFLPVDPDLLGVAATLSTVFRTVPRSFRRGISSTWKPPAISSSSRCPTGAPSQRGFL